MQSTTQLNDFYMTNHTFQTRTPVKDLLKSLTNTPTSAAANLKNRSQVPNASCKGRTNVLLLTCLDFRSRSCVVSVFDCCICCCCCCCCCSRRLQLLSCVSFCIVDCLLTFPPKLTPALPAPTALSAPVGRATEAEVTDPSSAPFLDALHLYELHLKPLPISKDKLGSGNKQKLHADKEAYSLIRRSFIRIKNIIINWLHQK